VPEPEPPGPLDLETVFTTLARHQVRYVLIGGVAARLHGSPLVTDDVDVTPATDRANLARLASALRDLDARFRVEGAPAELPLELDERSFDAFTTMTLTTRAGPLDVCIRPDGTGGYADLAKNAVEFELFGHRVRAAGLDDIIRSKTAAGRAVDLAALPVLHQLQKRLESG
jgi:hypothetical protein